MKSKFYNVTVQLSEHVLTEFGLKHPLKTSKKNYHTFFHNHNNVRNHCRAKVTTVDTGMAREPSMHL